MASETSKMVKLRNLLPESLGQRFVVRVAEPERCVVLFRVLSLRFGVWGVRFRVWGLGFGVQGFWFRI